METLKRQVGDGIRRGRTAAKLTQRQLSELSGVEQGKISQYEQGRYLPGIDKVLALDRGFGQPAGYVFRLSGITEETTDVAALIMAHPGIAPRFRDAIVALWEEATEGQSDSTAKVMGELAEAAESGRRRRTGPRRSA